MRYLPKVKVTHAQYLSGLRPGQWIDFEGSTGRFMGRIGKTVWIAWGGAATKRFATFAKAFHKEARRHAQTVSAP